jgi:hypothetical protein
LPESFAENFFRAHKEQIEKLQLKKLLNNTGEVLSLENFVHSTNLPVNAALYNKLKKILDTATTRYNHSGTDNIATFFRVWRKGSGKIRKIILWEKANREIPHNMVKFGETTDTVVNFETARILNTQWTRGYFSPAQRAFFYKLHNNILGINTRLSHFIREIDRNCEFCNITQVAEQDDETILHLFYNCPTTENLRERYFTEILGRDIGRQEFFGIPDFNRGSTVAIVKVVALLFMFYVWESKKRYCIPSYTFLKQFIQEEIKVMTICNKKMETLVTDSRIRF